MISKYSVKRPFTVLVGVVLILILGVVSFTSMKTDLLPDMTLPYAIVYTIYPGASPEEVETIVTRPVEQSMATISNIENISSISSENVSTVILEFSQSANMDAVTIEMRENLDQIEAYWDDSVGSPIIMKLNPDMLPVMVAALESDDLTQSELTDLVNNEILSELESIEGVASVSDSGTIEEQVQVTIREDKLKKVNRKVRNALDGQFEELESELEEGQEALEEGQQTLKDGQQRLIDQTSKADSQISSGSGQLITGSVQIDQKLAEVESGLTEMDEAEKELAEKEKELLDAEAALNALPSQMETLVAQQAQIQQGIEFLETASSALTALDSGISQLTAQVEILQVFADLLGGASDGAVTVPGEVDISGQDKVDGSIGEIPSEDIIEEVSPVSDVSGASDEAVDAYSEGDPAIPESGFGAASDPSAVDGALLTADSAPLTQTPEVYDSFTEYTEAAENSGASVLSEEAMEGDAATSVSEDMGDEGTGAASDGGMISGEISEDISEILGSITDASQSVSDLLNGMPTQDEMYQMIQNADIQTTLASMQAQLTQLTDQKAQLLAGLTALGIDTTKTGAALEAEIDTAKSELVSRKLQLDDGITSLQGTIDNMDTQLETIAQGKKAIVDGKAQIVLGRSQLEEAKTQLEAAKTQISTGESTISQAVSQLNAAKITATIEMAVGKAELNASQKELDAALEQIEQQKEAAYDQADVTEIVSADLVKGILAAQNFSMPAGYVTEEGIDYLVRVGNKLEDVEGLADLILLDLHIDGLEPIRLSDVADVVIVDNSDEIYAKINGNPGVLFSMQKQSGYSTGEVSDLIKEKFAQLEEEYNVHFVNLMDQGIYIDMVVDSVIENMLSGAGLAVLVLLVFLKSFQTTLVIAFSIPVSILAAIVLMYFSNISLNIISLSGLALGIGMLVDNSIVVIENIYRLRNEGYSAKKAAVEGASQVAGSIAASTLTTVCVFLPIVFTEGITRQLFVDMGLTIGYSLLASLAVALTVVPAMGAGLLKKSKEKKSRFFEALQNGYARVLRVSLKLKFLVLLLALGMLGASGYLAISKGTAFMPEMESTQVSITLQMPEGSTLAETSAMADEVESRILTIPDVTDVGAMAGNTNVMSMMGAGGSSSTDQVSMYVLLSEDMTLSNEELVSEIEDLTSDLICELDIETSTMDMSSLGGSGISINIKGRELDQLKKMAGEVAEILDSVEGTVNVSDGIAEKTLEQRLVVDKDRAMSYQLTTAQIYQFLQGKLADASSATTLSTLSKDYSVMVISDSDETLTRDKIKKLTITGVDEEQKEVDVPLTELVEFVDTEGFSSISRSAQTRYVTVSAEIDTGYNIGLVASDVEKALADYEIPDGYSLEMAGEDETINEAMTEVLKMLGLAVVFMYLIMVAQFQSLLSPFIIMFTIPLAFTGGLLGLYLTDNPVSVIAMIGFVMLSGIIVNNGIVLVDYINQLRRQGVDKKEAIVEAGRTRLRPILMTALTTILGLLTMAMGQGMGADMVQPMAIVTIGGLTYGTLLTLFVVPCIYDIFNRNKSMVEEEL